MKKLFLLIFFLFLVNEGIAAQRIISLSPAATEILYALDLDNQIIADTSFCNYPKKAKLLPKVGTFSDPNIETILGLKPDIIFATGLEQNPAVLRLRQMGFNVVVSDPKDFAGLLDSIKEFGKLTNKDAKAKEITIQMQERMNKIKDKVKLIPEEKKPRVFIEIWNDPIMTAGPGSLVDELLRLAGGKNIAYDIPKPYSRFSTEEIISRNPDVVILCYMTKENTFNLLSKRPGWKNIKALNNNRIISDIDPDIILRPSPRIVDGLEEIYKRIQNEK